MTSNKTTFEPLPLPDNFDVFNFKPADLMEQSGLNAYIDEAFAVLKDEINYAFDELEDRLEEAFEDWEMELTESH